MASPAVQAFAPDPYQKMKKRTWERRLRLWRALLRTNSSQVPWEYHMCCCFPASLSHDSNRDFLCRLSAADSAGEGGRMAILGAGQSSVFG